MLTCHCALAPAPPSAAAAPLVAPAAPSVPLTTMVAPHLRQRILTIFPWTFSSATLYLDWQDWQVIFIGSVPGEGSAASVYLDRGSPASFPAPSGSASGAV